jgi:hypothetical protein
VLITANWEVKLKASGAPARLVTDLDPTIKALLFAGKQVVVLPDLPQFNFDPQRCKFQRPFTQSTDCDEPKTNYIARLQTYEPALQEVKRLNPSMVLMDVSDVMCSPSVCSMTRNGQVLYRDNNHLNIPGSRYVGAQIVAQYPRLAQLRTP